MEKLKKLRNDLDMCDEIIADAMRMRFQIVQELTNYKQEHGMSMVQPEEEERKKALLNQKLGDYKYKDAVLKVHDAILYRSKRIQTHELFDFNIFLIGFMGVGKSTISKVLENTFAMDVMEMDEVIVENNGMSVSEIFEFHGEEYFRNEETELLRQCQNKKNVIVSCGGGVALRPVNVEEMKKSGKVVLLTASPETILERVKGNHDRPLLENNKNVDFIANMMNDRRAAYMSAADYIVNTDGKSTYEICEEIISQVGGQQLQPAA